MKKLSELNNNTELIYYGDLFTYVDELKYEMKKYPENYKNNKYKYYICEYEEVDMGLDLCEMFNDMLDKKQYDCYIEAEIKDEEKENIINGLCGELKIKRQDFYRILNKHFIGKFVSGKQGKDSEYLVKVPYEGEEVDIYN